MRNNFNERFENNANTEITNKSLTKCKEISCPESDYFDDLEELCDRVEKKQKDIKELPKEEDDLFEEKIEESEAAQEDSKKQKHILFSGKVDANHKFEEFKEIAVFVKRRKKTGQRPCFPCRKKPHSTSVYLRKHFPKS